MDKQQAKHNIQEIFEKSFDKDRFTLFIKNLLNRIEEASFTYQGQYVPEAYRQYIHTLERIGKFNDGENRIDILVVKLKKETSIDRARTMQRNFIAWYLNGSRGGEMKDAALAAFVAPNNEDWRFSLVKMDYRFEEGKSGKVKIKEEFTPARRWSFLVGKNENSHTAQSRLVPLMADDEHSPTLAEIEEAFNIEKVTKEFFEKYRYLFLRTKETLDEVVSRDTNIKEDFESKGVSTVDFAKKLLGQIVFLYFLQKKGWFGVTRDTGWGTGSKHFLRELFEGRHGTYNNFFNDILEPLFYEALRIDRGHDDGYYSRFNCKIPFLNGGLFDPINNYDWVHTDIILPNELFSNAFKTKEGDTGNGILDIFDRYNFTVKEDEPLEKEVAVDPEMLGKVFENLLEVKDRKSKGTYYTPREIVHYMCQQSLINYLYAALNDATVSYEKLGKEQTVMFKDIGNKPQLDLTIEHRSGPVILKEEIETLIKYGEQVGENEATVVAKGRETDTYFYKLSESIRQNAELIDDKLADIKVCDPAIGSGAFPVGMMSEIVKTRNVLSAFIHPPQSPLDKWGSEGGSRTIYNFKRECIEKSLYGVDIDPGAVEIAKLRLWLSLVVDEDDIREIKPLPNLDYKIVCGNSLLGVEKNLFNDDLFKELERIKPYLFNETSPTKKQEYKKQIDDLISRITDGHKEFDFEVYFSEVFHEKKGFDVVIANPPYVRQEDIKDQKPVLQKQGYEVYNSTSDLYTYFYEKSHQVLRDRGIFCFITSNKFMRAKYGEKLRKFLQEKTLLNQIIDFGGHKVFESATVDTCIVIFEKQAFKSRHSRANGNPESINKTKDWIPVSAGMTANENEVRFVNISDDFKNSHDLAVYLTEKGFCIPQSKLSPQHWTLADNSVLRLKEKIERIGTALKDWDVRIYRGVITGFNEAFIIDDETKERLCKEDQKNTEILKPILRGRDIERYSYKWAGFWLIKIESGWTNKNRGKKDPERFFKETYPAVYEHLKSMGEKKGKGKGLYNRDDQGATGGS